MSTTAPLSDHLRAHARRRLDRVEPSDEGRNARLALALIDAACYVDTLPEDDPVIVALRETGMLKPDGFEPGDREAQLLAEWSGGDPAQLLAALAR
ncbi:hypothetical protein [Herbidospora cretacea]|uniref:hypothetical protein n=1 Tax=Herbidospora cretacea TaxID=28444 RepID=UPI000773F25C|nr:hypothetical protein [Herbidospora cretacea]